MHGVNSFMALTTAAWSFAAFFRQSQLFKLFGHKRRPAVVGAQKL